MSQHEIILPAPWRPLAGSGYSVHVEGETAGAVLRNLAATYPQLADRLYAGTELHPYLLVFVGETEIRRLQGEATPLPPGLPVRILIAISGG